LLRMLWSFFLSEFQFQYEESSVVLIYVIQLLVIDLGLWGS
jgi:hypothetical protein